MRLLGYFQHENTSLHYENRLIRTMSQPWLRFEDLARIVQGLACIVKRLIADFHHIQECRFGYYFLGLGGTFQEPT